MATVFERIKKIIVDQLGVEEEEVVELMMSLEEEFSNPSQKIEIPDEDAEKMATIQDAIDYLKDLGIKDS